MKFRFKIKSYQTEAVKAVVECFDGHPLQTGLGYRIDPGRVATGQQARLEMDAGFKNPDLLLPPEVILKNIQAAGCTVPFRSSPSSLEILSRTSIVHREQKSDDGSLGRPSDLTQPKCEVSRGQSKPTRAALSTTSGFRAT